MACGSPVVWTLRSTGPPRTRHPRTEARRYKEGVDMGKLDGKVALISGGARGQGAAEAETFAREGAKGVFGDVRDAEGQKVAATIRAHGGGGRYRALGGPHEVGWETRVRTAT